MRSLGQLTARARRAPAPHEEGAPRRPPPGGSGGCPAAPRAPASREALVRLVEAVAPRLGPRGLTDKDLRALRAIVTACRWEDFVRADRDPVCFRQQQRLAAEVGVTPGHFRKIETKLERAGLIARATCENGHRGRLAPGPDAPVAGLSLAPLLASLPRLEALAEALAAERAALAEGRALIRIERRAARRAAEGLADGHPARAAYEALRGAGFRPSARFATRAAIAEHLAELHAVIAAVPAPGPEAAVEAIDEAAATSSEGLDNAIRSGAPRAQERRHTEDPTDPQTGSWSGAAGGETAPGSRASGAGQTEAQDREEGERVAARHHEGDGSAGTRRREGAETPGPDAGEDAEDGAGDDAGPRGTCLPRGVAARLTPALLRELGSEEMRLYVDHLDPHRGPPTLRDVERAALMRRRELGVSPALWEEVEAAMGWLDALVALVVVDANHRHPTAPVRNPAGLLRDLARRRRAGALDLGASVMGLWRRRAEK